MAIVFYSPLSPVRIETRGGKEASRRETVKAGMHLNNKFGRRLREARQGRGYTQMDAAGRIDGLTASALSNYERGVRDPDTRQVARLATLYGVTLDWLLGNEADPEILSVYLDHLSPEMQAFVRREVAAGCPWLHLLKEMLERGLTSHEIEQILTLFVEVKEGAERKAGSGSHTKK